MDCDTRIDRRRINPPETYRRGCPCTRVNTEPSDSRYRDYVLNTSTESSRPAFAFESTRYRDAKDIGASTPTTARRPSPSMPVVHVRVQKRASLPLQHNTRHTGIDHLQPESIIRYGADIEDTFSTPSLVHDTRHRPRRGYGSQLVGTECIELGPCISEMKM